MPHFKKTVDNYLQNYNHQRSISFTMRKYNDIRAMKGADEKALYKKKLYSRYTHLGGRNFITYGLRAANKMESNTIKKQLKPLWRRFHEELDKD